MLLMSTCIDEQIHRVWGELGVFGGFLGQQLPVLRPSLSVRAERHVDNPA